MATQQLSITVVSGLTISTSELPGATVNTSYSQTLSAAGGSLPYSWSVSTGSLPTGLSLAASTGVLSGTPTVAGVYNFTVRLTDGTATTTIHTFSISVTAGSSGMPQAVINGLTDTASAAQQLPIDVQLAAVYSSNVSGTITATFEPDAAAPADDPAIQFTTGGRSANFSIPANTQHAVFAVSQMALQTGTVAGTISLDITLQSTNGASTTLARSIRIARAAPVIRNVAVVKNANGFEIHITGLATSREVTEAELQFQPAAGSSVQTSSLTVNLSDAAKQWYQSASSAPFGSQFFLILPFNVQGGVNQIGGATVSLKNSVGISPVASATF